MEQFITGAKGLGLVVQPYQQRQFQDYLEQLLTWNRRVNLTSVTQPEQVETIHFLDSITVALALPGPLRSGGRLADVGSGAGFPGVPLKILFPGMALTLIDSIAKKTAFLQHLSDVLKLQGMDICTGRAENLAHTPALRERFDAVVSRAVGSLRLLAELTLPFCRIGGHAILQKKGDISHELERAQGAFAFLGGGFLETRAIPPNVLGGERVLIVVEKVRPTPTGYPRRAGVPAKRPL